jgi:hypothetical protein
MQMWTEILFNVSYLIVVWGFVLAMQRRHGSLSPDVRSYAPLFTWAFGLLALGDTGHVGFRVWAYAAGDLEFKLDILGARVSLVGLGTLSTAITVTLFYALMVFIWQRRFDRPLGWFGYLLLAAVVVRLGLMAFPQNDWNSIVPPERWSVVRNVPLLILGLGVACLILRDAAVTGDRTFKWVGSMILVSFGFYVPVILFARQIPMLGMLMIPKTMAYVAIAWLAFANLFPRSARV